MRRGSAAGSGGGGAVRVELAGGSWSKNDLRNKWEEKKKMKKLRDDHREILHRLLVTGLVVWDQNKRSHKASFKQLLLSV